MKDFSKVFCANRRKLVLHETCYYEDDFILGKLNDYDILFFDDCLYSQYVFLKNNIDVLKQKQIICVFGFSTGIHREEDHSPRYYAKCANSHDRVHFGDISAYDNYMSLPELFEICKFDNVFIACHGQFHLQLQSEKLVQRSKKFIDDVKNAHSDLVKFNLNTDIFVYPYAFDDIIGSNLTLRQLGYKFIFANKQNLRIVFESLDSKQIEYG